MENIIFSSARLTHRTVSAERERRRNWPSGCRSRGPPDQGTRRSAIRHVTNPHWNLKPLQGAAGPAEQTKTSRRRQTLCRSRGRPSFERVPGVRDLRRAEKVQGLLHSAIRIRRFSEAGTPPRKPRSERKSERNPGEESVRASRLCWSISRSGPQSST